ncbi:uncharacterized protein PGTG_00908 [Puccinia graminis f. sp. tritici CRL 75-36-700-3]|uniref:Uncharacterized protein n=1 Tax=Puccinia graminis f. sp. tritici (strain CRL 75-36-700-3 / race SCCL) TaxID=418459 RepID=E3JU46_PUCGT|nr:uncharacterized protein PGTG_00908 [Puccinia graminis f. sp. tritici CRL 75-36-700-3]EFP75577.1 hypothetical protein PGTG_00908 [Puccinia graminis f. sp. tritici CRL 75-36-700-3]
MSTKGYGLIGSRLSIAFQKDLNLPNKFTTPPVHLDVQVAGSRGMAPGQPPPQIRASQARAPPKIKGQPWDVLVERPCDVPPKHPTDGQEVFEGRLLQNSKKLLQVTQSRQQDRDNCMVVLQCLQFSYRYEWGSGVLIPHSPPAMDL